ncbi:hypothetical protein BT67DRAFT_374898 [Trichocladium antarcticum]|uniref:A to I editase domain-containing protein n=1 Tax=Trichocladium antarcticum TaxID=1450529 RepID=A0AAN6UQH3_9PEZI|nr:hypothetical protein BT67DRAFT_374898 [Trichocladium antarcticum]
MKCLPASKLPYANGVALHDWHAEVLALRAFNRFVLDECRRLAQDRTAGSDFLRRRTHEELSALSSNSHSPFWSGQSFAWREDRTLHMYCSEAPCGDASMELIMSSQEDATPWASPPSPSPSPSPTQSQSQSQPQPPTQPPPVLRLLGRGYFSHLGIVRRKPSRPDAPPTHSKSCSDKLALKQCTSALSSLAALFVAPAAGAYLASIVLPASQFSAEGCRRCFATRMGVVGGGGGEVGEGKGREWGGGYGFAGVRVVVTAGEEFEFSRRGILAAAAAAAGGGGGGGKEDGEVRMAASNLAVAWTMDGAVEEGLIGGVLQGRRGVDVKGASLVSRRRMWMAAVEVAAALGDEEIMRELRKGTYDEVKEGALLEARRKVKEEARAEALKGWVRNTGDGGFSL